MTISAKSWFIVTVALGAAAAVLGANRLLQSLNAVEAVGEKKIGSAQSREFRSSPDGIAVAWLEPARGGRSGSDLFEYRADADRTRRIEDVEEYSYSSTGELALIRQAGASQRERVLFTLGRNEDQQKFVGRADQWWLGPGGTGALVYRGRVSVWGPDGVVRALQAQLPVEVIPAEQAGLIRLLVRDAAGRLIAVLSDGRVADLGNGSGPIAVARDGSAAALAECRGRGGVCIWRQASRPDQVLPILNVSRLEFDSTGSSLAVVSGSVAGRRLVVATPREIIPLDDKVQDVAWSKRSPVLIWRSESATDEESIALWNPTTGSARLSCGESGVSVASASVSPDGKSVACTGVDANRDAGVLWIGAATAKRADVRVSDTVVQYGFSPIGNVLWIRRRCARGELGCEIAIAAISSGVRTGPLTRLTGIGRRIEFDDARSPRMLFDSDLHGWELIVRGTGYHQRLGDVRWGNVALLPSERVAYLRDEPNGGVFVWTPSARVREGESPLK